MSTERVIEIMKEIVDTLPNKDQINQAIKETGVDENCIKYIATSSDTDEIYDELKIEDFEARKKIQEICSET
jgi:hypothetical protein